MIDVACEQTTASISPGLIPASAMLFCWRPVVGPNAFDVPMPVSNRISLSPVFTIGEFCSSTTLSGLRKLSESILPYFLIGTPTKVPLGGPSGSVPSETHGHFGVAEHEAVPVGVCVPSLGALASALPPSMVEAPDPHRVLRRAQAKTVAKRSVVMPLPPTVFMNCSLLPDRFIRDYRLRSLAEIGKWDEAARQGCEKCDDAVRHIALRRYGPTG
jgi:hypothetical protein